jgi:hypothetical protein
LKRSTPRDGIGSVNALPPFSSSQGALLNFPAVAQTLITVLTNPPNGRSAFDQIFHQFQIWIATKNQRAYG